MVMILVMMSMMVMMVMMVLREVMVARMASVNCVQRGYYLSDLTSHWTEM